MKTNKQFIAETLFSLRENPEFTVGENYESLRWHSQDVEKPTKEEFEARLELLKKEEPMRLLREERDRLLSETDWWVLPDRTSTQAQLDYRQALRDLPANSPNVALDENGNLTGVTWPTPPE